MVVLNCTLYHLEPFWPIPPDAGLCFADVHDQRLWIAYSYEDRYKMYRLLLLLLLWFIFTCWWLVKHIATTCSHGMVYKACGSSCPVSCSDLSKSAVPRCHTPCVEGCHCPDNMILFNGLFNSVQNRCSLYSKYLKFSLFYNPNNCRTIIKCVKILKLLSLLWYLITWRHWRDINVIKMLKWTVKWTITTSHAFSVSLKCVNIIVI